MEETNLLVASEPKERDEDVKKIAQKTICSVK